MITTKFGCLPDMCRKSNFVSGNVSTSIVHDVVIQNRALFCRTFRGADLTAFYVFLILIGW